MGTPANLSAARRLELASYLKARRASLQPHDVGLDPPPRRRNTPGLRREEIALLSGVGVTWYTWLEQGRPIATSEPVIDALARTLRLDREAHRHLRRLAGLPLPDLDQIPEGASPDVTRVLDTVLPAPACLLGPRFDFVAWNETFSHIWQPETLPEGRCNVMWLAFAEPGRRRTWVNWERRSRVLLAAFRAAAGEHAGDSRFAELVSALSDASDEFRSWWSTYRGTRVLRRTPQGPGAWHRHYCLRRDRIGGQDRLDPHSFGARARPWGRRHEAHDDGTRRSRKCMTCTRDRPDVDQPFAVLPATEERCGSALQPFTCCPRWLCGC